MEAIKKKLDRFWQSLDDRVKRAPASDEDKIRLKHYIVFTSCGVPTMFLFWFVNLLRGNLLLCGLILGSAVGLVIGCYKLLSLRDGKIVFRLNGVVFGALLIYMFIFGGVDGSKSLWMFTFPLIVFFLLGKIEGLVWAVSMLAIALLSLIIPVPFVDKYPYGSEFITRFTTIYVIICIITYWFEHFRFSYRCEILLEQRRFQEILNHSRDILYRRDLKTGKYQYISKALSGHLGYSPQEVASFTYQDVIAIIHPDDRTEHDQVLPQILRGDLTDYIAPPVEFRMRHKDGSYRWFSDQIAAVCNDNDEVEAVLGVNREITCQRELKQALEDAKNQLVTILNSIDAHIYVADMENHQIFFMNSKMKEDFGHNLEGSICWKEFRNSNSPCEHCTNDQLLDQDGEPTGVKVWEGFNPLTNRWYNNYDRAIRWVDGRWVRIQIAVDITVLKQMEEERQRNKDIIIRAQHLEAIGTMAGGIAHDFNNLLQIIFGNLSLAEHVAPFPQESQNCFKEIKKAIQKAQELANRMVSLSSEGTPEKVSMHLGPILTQISAELTAKTSITRELQIDPNLWHVTVDYNHIVIVVRNIITNSCESIVDKGCLRIVAENQLVTSDSYKNLNGMTEGKYVKISIIDDGSGIAKPHIPKIFEPYFSTKERSSRKGLGLGLATAYSIITQNGGHIFVESEPDSGTSVFVFLPAESNIEQGSS